MPITISSDHETLCERVEQLVTALFDETTWRWWEDLEDEHDAHDWDMRLVYFDVRERCWYVVCANLDAMARVDPSTIGSSLEVQFDLNEDEDCILNEKREYASFDELNRLIWTDEDRQALFELMAWEV